MEGGGLGERAEEAARRVHLTYLSFFVQEEQAIGGILGTL